MRALRIYGVAIVALIFTAMVLLFITKSPYPSVNLLQYSPPKTHASLSRGVLEEKLRTLYDGVQTFVLFIGYARSGHSLVGAILDAHPEIVIPHEFKVISYWRYYKNKYQTNKVLLRHSLFFDLHTLSRRQAMFGNRASCLDRLGHSYCYNVPGQWQGTYKDKIKVIGDKKGTATSSLLRNSENFQVLDEMQNALQIPLKFIHVIRNPFDNIATKLLRQLDSRDLARGKSFKVNNSTALDTVITDHFKLVESAQRLHQYGKYEVLDIYSHEIISHPQENLKKLCSFLGVADYEDFIDASSNLLYSKPSFTRYSVVWTNEQIERVSNEMKKYPFMKPFSFFSN